MKKLQNNFTTPEQSKRLLELGVPSDSADYYFEKCTGDICIIKKGTFSTFCDNSEIPCWSVGRLIELHEILFPQYKNFVIERDDVTLISRMVRYYEICAEQGVLDFSKLEE